MSKNRTIINLLALSAVILSAPALAADVQTSARPDVIREVKHDTSPPLAELLQIAAENESLDPAPLEPPDHVYPNFDFEDQGNSPTSLDKTLVGAAAAGAQRSFAGVPSAPPLGESFDGIGQSDAPGGGLPPDTNGDVGPNHFIQYINTDWVIIEKKTGDFVAPGVLEGNTFWAGFGGPCETSNAGDPLVLYDKLADRWVFTQFTGTATNRQCFAVTTGSDPAGPYNRYEFDFSPVFNDYPHISIWTDASGERSGYYLTTHDFQPSGGGFNFLQNSFSVVDRDAMLAGDEAELIRFTDTGFAGASSFGALSAHLESTELPPAGACAPFVHNRADLDSYLLWELCVDWDNTDNTTLTGPRVLAANNVFDNAVDNIPQPPPAPPGSELDNFAGNTMYRVSARAYPTDSGLPVELVLNHSTNAGDGLSGVRWVQVALPAGDTLFAGGFETSEPLPNGLPKIVDEGVYAPDNDYRWMAGISIDQSRNIGLGYTVSSTTTFPSVRYTGKTPADEPGLMRDEQNCVIGNGVQTFVDSTGRAGRWGDYSSMSVDPLDQCTFWLTVEYITDTGTADWENRVCSFTFPECGDATFFASTDFSQDIKYCALNDDPQANITLQSLGFTDPVNLSASGVPTGVTVDLENPVVNTLPANSTFLIDGLETQGDGSFTFTVNASSGAVSRSVDFNVSTSSGIAAAPVLQNPADGGEGSVRPTFTWNADPGALEYKIEIATDAAFNDIIATAVTTETSFVAPQTFDEGVIIFWRVTASNNCGAGATASASFTTIPAGQCPSGTTANIVFDDDLESGAAGWTTPASGVGPELWALSNVRQNSGQFSFFAVDPPTQSDQFLVSPAIILPAAAQAPITLSYWNFQNIEANTGAGVDACWDAGILEVSTDGGSTFTQVPDDQLLTDPYNGTVTAQGAITISGQPAWCADDIVPASGDQEVVQVVDVTSLAGQTVQFRYRFASDAAVGDEGWYIDDVTVQGCQSN